MAGAAKRRANNERQAHQGAQPLGSSSGETSSSGKASRSAPPSNAGSHGGRSVARSGRGYDGNRDPDSPSSASERNPATSRVQVDPKNVDMGMASWSVMRGYDVPGTMPKRTSPSTLGQGIQVGLNTFNVEILPTASVYQFDVMIGNGVEKRGLVSKVWKSKAVQAELGKGWIFDGNKLAWNLKPITREVRLTVDLDAEEGKTPRPGGKENKHRIMIRQTNRVRLDVLMGYLEGKITFDNSCLEAITFLDHLLREYPSLRYTTIKRMFFARGQERFTLGSAVEAFKGVYQSMRIVHGGPGQKARVSINLDVANGTFWSEGLLHMAAVQLTGRRDVADLVTALRQGDKSSAAQNMKKMRKLHVTANHRGGNKDTYVIERFVFKSARDEKFEKDGKQVSVYEYFAKQYNIRLQYPDLPLVKTTGKKGIMLPMEVLKIDQNQRYQFKMDERQTANMIKFAVTPPPERWQAVEHGLRMLDWQNDPVHQAFGLKINPKKVIVPGRLIVAPTVKYAAGDKKPGTSGRWDLKGVKFLQANPAPLKSWGVCVVPGRRGGKPDPTIVKNFIKQFITIYAGHGGRVENKEPFFCLAQGDDVGSWVTMVWNGAGNQSQSRPQILVFVLPDKDTNNYGRIKRSADCRYGVVSQCMQYAHVQKCQPQYISNVCMKFNSKLGGK